ncbi:hypothetical protein Purlil1_12980 [Purpureocillium lilacinum]|uniref:Chromo domain-containing protein n=1 Tax=Purpureocillium lilacinum TaxID=33203 RepID=A0ABR0BFF2_PURLI|nr:hypothetical protein Purlil1_12980 [Purpureocillium lilacinum]
MALSDRLDAADLWLLVALYRFPPLRGSALLRGTSLAVAGFELGTSSGVGQSYDKICFVRRRHISVFLAGGLGGSKGGRKRNRTGRVEPLLIIGCKTARNGQDKFLLQKVGYPSAQPIWRDEDSVKGRWPHKFGQFNRISRAGHRARQNSNEPRLVAIVGHRLKGKDGTQKRIQLSCQWTNDTESWEDEYDVQSKYNPAVLTDRPSDPKVRRSYNVPKQRLRVGGHKLCRTTLFLKAQIGSTREPNVPLEPVGKLLLKWPGLTEKCLKDQSGSLQREPQSGAALEKIAVSNSHESPWIVEQSLLVSGTSATHLRIAASCRRDRLVAS